MRTGSRYITNNEHTGKQYTEEEREFSGKVHLLYSVDPASLKAF